jgi:pimeloyl-ACP methyl ester carboxylesterase
MKRGRIEANGLDFAYLEQGTGPLVLFLHGYPDNAHTWEYQMPAVAELGFRCVAPFLRGYPPTAVPPTRYSDRGTLAKDIAELIGALNQGEPAHIVSQDWGAAITYGVLGAYPECVRSAIVMAIPHPAMIRQTLTSPAHIHRAFHWWFFQLPEVPEAAVEANNFAFIDYLWDYWSPGHADQAHLERIKRMFAEPGAVRASIDYYRAAFNPTFADPALAAVRARLDSPITIPTLAICGCRDIRGEVLEAQRTCFRGDYKTHIVEDCGHFLHREQPEQVNALIEQWLRR